MSDTRGTATRSVADRLPPLRARVVGSKIAISCEKPGEFLIRAWTVKWHSPEKLVDWVLHYVGRLDLDGLEWWGYTYPGQPSYMASGVDPYGSGLTIQRFAEPTDQWVKKALDEGKIGPAYLPPDHLPIPERGIVQRCGPAGGPQ